MKIIRPRSLVQSLFNSLGYQVVKIRHRTEIPYDMDQDFKEIYFKTRSFTQTAISNMYAMYSSVKYLVENNIPGDIVECGVWKGGSAMIAALALANMKETTRRLWLYDTYEGMTEPSDADVQAFDGLMARKRWESAIEGDVNSWNYVSLEEVMENVLSTKYPKQNIDFVKGRVEDTIPKFMPENIALLRLDTDFYESTAHELIHLFPRLSKQGVLIIDDYGWWKGSRKATDEYIEANKIPLLLNRIDEGARIAIKT